MNYHGIFDSHAHYDDPRFQEDWDELIHHLNESGVCGIINVGCDLALCKSSIALADRYDFFYATVGIHPHDAKEVPDDYLTQLEAFASHPKVVAIGEIGLDYHYDNSPRDVQCRVFEEQLQLAEKLQLPVVIHLREATEDGMALLKKYRPRGVVHCFSGSAETAEEVVKLGMYIGFTGVLTFSNAKRAKRAVQAIPLDRLLLETDCPYMAPSPFRGERCDSSMIAYTAEEMARLKGIPTQTMIDLARENTCRLFGISPS